MDTFETSIKKLGWPKLRELLQRYTDKWRKAVSISAFITAILNSSTLVSLLTLGFVGAGIMPLVNAVGIIIWANIWSTATGLIVALLGSWDLNIGIVAMPMITVWGLIFLTTQSKHLGYRAKWLIGFGLFFLGIGMFKENIDAMKTVFDLSQYADMNLWVFGLIGMIVTAIVHSSGAVGVMTMAALSSNIIWFEASFAIILGANIGTTFSSLLVSLHGSTAKKQIGIANVLFNIITVGIGVILFHPYIWFTNTVLWYASQPVMGNAMINFIFNFTTSIAFIPFLKNFTKLIIWIIPNKQEEFPLKVLKYSLPDNEERYDSDSASIALRALQEDKKYLTKQSLEYISFIWGVDVYRIKNNRSHANIIDNLIKFDNEKHRAFYTSLKDQFDIIFTYIQRLSPVDLDWDDRKELNILLEEFIALNNSCKAIENIREDIIILREAIDPHAHTLYCELLDIIIRLNRASYTIIWTKWIKDKEDILVVLADMKSYRNNILTHISPFVTNGNVGDIDVSSLINMNWELTECINDLGKSLSSIR